MGIDFSTKGLKQFCEWASSDKKIFRKLEKMIEDIRRNGHNGANDEEALKGDMSGWYSRRIDEKNRLVYRILDNGNIEIILCAGHYNDK